MLRKKAVVMPYVLEVILVVVALFVIMTIFFNDQFPSLFSSTKNTATPIMVDNCQLTSKADDIDNDNITDDCDSCVLHLTAKEKETLGIPVQLTSANTPDNDKDKDSSFGICDTDDTKSQKAFLNLVSGSVETECKKVIAKYGKLVARPDDHAGYWQCHLYASGTS